MIEIKQYLTNKVLFSGDFKDRLECLKIAAKQGIDLSYADFRNANFNNADLSGIKLNSINFQGANLESVNFNNSKLIGCDFRGANLSCAKFYNTDLRGANFCGSNLQNTDLLIIQGSKYTIYATSLSIRIGCMLRKLDWWIENGEIIARKAKRFGGEEFNEDEISEYKNYIELYIKRFGK